MKRKALVLAAVLALASAGCGRKEQGQTAVYSFRGGNEWFTVSNGVIVLNGGEEIFAGGDLELDDDFCVDPVLYSTTFYVMSGGGRKVILSNEAVDLTGGAVSVSGDLGKISGKGIISRTAIDIPGDLEKNLYFELEAADRDGKNMCTS